MGSAITKRRHGERITERQKQFAREYVRNRGNGARAAMRAYCVTSYGSARALASENLHKPQVQAEIERLLKTVPSPEDATLRLRRQIRSDDLGVSFAATRSLIGLLRVLSRSPALKASYPLRHQRPYRGIEKVGSAHPICGNPTVTKRLTLKQRLWVEQYLSNGLNGTRAALRVYNTSNPRSAHSIASENLTKPAVADEISRQISIWTGTIADLFKVLSAAFGSADPILRLRALARWLEVAGLMIELGENAAAPDTFAGELLRELEEQMQCGPPTVTEAVAVLKDGLSSPKPRIFFKAFDLWLECRALGLRHSDT